MMTATFLTTVQLDYLCSKLDKFGLWIEVTWISQNKLRMVVLFSSSLLLPQVDWCWHPCSIFYWKRSSPFAANSCQMMQNGHRGPFLITCRQFSAPFLKLNRKYLPRGCVTEIFSILPKVLWNFSARLDVKLSKYSMSSVSFGPGDLKAFALSRKTPI